MAFSTSFPKTRLWSLSGWDQWLTDNRELLSWSLRDITKIFRIPHLFPRQLYLQIFTTDTMLSAFFFHGFFAGFPSSFVDRVSWVEYFKRVLVFNRCIFCSLQFRLTLQRMKHPGIKYYTLVLVACENIRFSSLFADGGSEERGETDVFAGYTFSLSFHTYFLVHRRMTQETPKASAFNCYIFKRLTGVVAIESEYLFSFSVKRLDATQFRGWSGKFYSGDPNFGSERTVELFGGKSLLKETTTCFSICERRSPLARERLLCEQRRTDQRRVPKNDYISNIPGI